MIYGSPACVYSSSVCVEEAVLVAGQEFTLWWSKNLLPVSASPQPLTVALRAGNTTSDQCSVLANSSAVNLQTWTVADPQFDSRESFVAGTNLTITQAAIQSTPQDSHFFLVVLKGNVCLYGPQNSGRSYVAVDNQININTPSSGHPLTAGSEMDPQNTALGLAGIVGISVGAFVVVVLAMFLLLYAYRLRQARTTIGKTSDIGDIETGDIGIKAAWNDVVLSRTSQSSPGSSCYKQDDDFIIDKRHQSDLNFQNEQNSYLEYQSEANFTQSQITINTSQITMNRSVVSLAPEYEPKRFSTDSYLGDSNIKRISHISMIEAVAVGDTFRDMLGQPYQEWKRDGMSSTSTVQTNKL